MGHHGDGLWRRECPIISGGTMIVMILVGTNDISHGVWESTTLWQVQTDRLHCANARSLTASGSQRGSQLYGTHLGNMQIEMLEG